MKVSQEGKPKKKKIVVLVSVAVTILIAVLLWFGNKKYREYLMDSSAEEGNITLDSSGNRSDAENFHFQIQVSPIFQNGMAEGELMIVNPEDNAYNTSVEITLDEKSLEDKNTKLYTSEVLKPGERIRFITLAQNLKKGTYPATAMFTIIDRESGNPIGKTAAQLSITVLE